MSVPTRATSFTPNHFVPLVRKPNEALSSPVYVNVDVDDTDVTDNSVTLNVSDTEKPNGALSSPVYVKVDVDSGTD